jgi:hypothetical protein
MGLCCDTSNRHPGYGSFLITRFKASGHRPSWSNNGAERLFGFAGPPTRAAARLLSESGSHARPSLHVSRLCVGITLDSLVTARLSPQCAQSGLRLNDSLLLSWSSQVIARSPKVREPIMNPPVSCAARAVTHIARASSRRPQQYHMSAPRRGFWVSAKHGNQPHGQIEAAGTRPR